MIRHFLYYVAGLSAGPEVKGALVRAVGPSVAGGDLRVANTAHGPGQQGPGVLFAAVRDGLVVPAGEIERRLKYVADPARQVWMEADGFWVGYEVDARPGPEDLERAKMVDGYPYQCRDTGSWVVPLARYADGGTNLDQRIVYLPSREIEMRPLQRYEALCAFAAEHFEYLSGVYQDELDLMVTYSQRFADVACEALGVNYHVGPYELSLLGMLTKDASVLICGLLCDWPGLMRILAEKKTASAAPALDTNCGEVDV